MKLLQLVNRTILALLVFACFSFVSKTTNTTSVEKDSLVNKNSQQIEYYIIHIFPNSSTSSEKIRECLSDKFIFISLLNIPNSIGETWKIKFRHHTTTGVLSNDPEEAEIPCHFPYYLSPYTDPIFSPPSLKAIDLKVNIINN